DKLGDISPVTSGSTPPDRDEGLKEGILLLKTANIRNGFMDLEDPSYIDERLDETLKSTRLKPHDILINIVGATLDVIGRVAVVPPNFPRANITQAMALVRIENKKYLPEYVFAFLVSKYGRLQISRLARPTGQYNVNHKEIREIIIPHISQQKQVRDIVLQFFKLMKSSDDQYNMAIELLLSKINPQHAIFKHTLTYASKYSEVYTSDRIDAEYYQPTYKKIIKDIIKNSDSVDKLGNIVEFSKGTEVGSDEYRDEGIPFIRVSNITKFGIDYHDVKFIGKKLSNDLKSQYKPSVGEILLTKDASMGVALVLREDKEQIISGGILRGKLKTDIDMDMDYLALVLNSMAVRTQIERDVNGSVIDHWKPEQIDNTIIPILHPSLRKKIGDTVRKSRDALDEAICILHNLINTIEKTIESKNRVVNL
ncbi:MAG: hypothetical protein ACRDFB_05570, partial [Rhabdochlamydiaceae bacterium]